MDTAVKKPAEADMQAPAIDLVSVTACAPSPTNPRKRFDKDKLAELAESIREHGILQPILVRPAPAGSPTGVKFEIVAGERRWRAAKIAGHAHVPASIRNIPDTQVLELQLTENLQRDDLDPLEEADGYKQLMALKKINADALAELLGKSRSYVYTRTKLNDLCPEGRKALQEGKLDASRALLIARIGHHDTQRQALKDAAGNRYDGPKSYRELQEHIREHYMLRLVDAPFDASDPELVPKAGPCTICPKRTGNAPDLFGDVKGADVCTDPKCFDAKRQAHFSVERKAIEAKGQKIIAGDAAKKILPRWDNPSWDRDKLDSGGYLSLDSETWASGSRKKVSDLLPENYEPILIQHPRTGRLIKVATQQAVAAAAGKKGKRFAGDGGSSLPRPAKPKGPDVDDDLRDRLVKLMHEKAPATFTRSWIRELAAQVFEACHIKGSDLSSTAKAFGWPAKAFGTGWYGARIPKPQFEKLGERDLLLFMFDLVFLDGGYYRRPKLLKLFGIKESDEREFVIEARKKASAAARTAKKSAKPAAKSKKK